jgi:hypothetical protein
LIVIKDDLSVLRPALSGIVLRQLKRSLLGGFLKVSQFWIFLPGNNYVLEAAFKFKR